MSVPIKTNQKSSILQKVTTIVLTLVVLMIAWGGMRYVQGEKLGEFLSSSEYHAVALTSGDIYFGTVEFVGRDYIRMENIYLPTFAPSAEDSETPELILQPVTNQFYQPQNGALFSMDSVMSIQNLDEGSQVIEAIEEFTNSK
jgi:hypothetical protein